MLPHKLPETVSLVEEVEEVEVAFGVDVRERVWN